LAGGPVLEVLFPPLLPEPWRGKGDVRGGGRDGDTFRAGGFCEFTFFRTSEGEKEKKIGEEKRKTDLFEYLKRE